MPPTLVLIRHAEAEHNATGMILRSSNKNIDSELYLENWDLLDPSLTERGIEQCRLLQDHLRKQTVAKNIEYIVTSPLRRTLQTTLVGLDWLIEQGVGVEVDAMWQENSDSPCDTGSDLRTIAGEFPGLDFSNVDPRFPDKSLETPYAFKRSVNIARGQTCLQRLYERPEKAIAVVSHAGFLRTATSRRRYANADYRIFSFRRSKNGHLSLVEHNMTARRGGGMGKSEKGLQQIEAWDFPPEDLIATAIGNHAEQV